MANIQSNQLLAERWSLSLILSVVAHLALAASLAYWSQHSTGDLQKTWADQRERMKSRKVEVVLIDNSPNAINSNMGPAHYLAAKNQRVQEQTQARFKGNTENKEFPSLKDLIPKTKSFTKSRQDIKANNNNGHLAVANAKREMAAMTQSPNDRPKGISTLSESLPTTIKYGDFTALNTDQYLYYSFFSRIAPRIRFQWENNVEQVVESMYFRNLGIRTEKEFTTEVEVIIDSKGYYKQTTITKSCGIPLLDEAVVVAFQRATPFINPPKEMVRDDGLIRLTYGFRVHYNPHYVVDQSL